MDIPFVHGAIHGTMGQITTFTTETPSYEETIQIIIIWTRINSKSIKWI